MLLMGEKQITSYFADQDFGSRKRIWKAYLFCLPVTGCIGKPVSLQNYFAFNVRGLTTGKLTGRKKRRVIFKSYFDYHHLILQSKMTSTLTIELTGWISRAVEIKELFPGVILLMPHGKAFPKGLQTGLICLTPLDHTFVQCASTIYFRFALKR